MKRPLAAFLAMWQAFLSSWGSARGWMSRAAGGIFLGIALGSAGTEKTFSAAPVLTPGESIQLMQVAPGFGVETVAAEPMIQDPVAACFDERGRLWVVEMRGFMPDVDGRGEEAPVGRVSVLEDRDGDGRMEAGRVFVDGLVMPRAIARCRNGVLIGDHRRLIWVEEAEGTGRAGRTEIVDADFAKFGNPEHSPNGLMRGLDHWFYCAKSNARYRWDRGGWVRDWTEFRGQWGIAQDSFGRLFYNFNGSQLHVDLAPPNLLSRNPAHRPMVGLGVAVTTNQMVYPARPTPAVNRGYLPGVLDESGRIREFTSAGAPFVYRGAQFPEDYREDIWVCEPAGNLIKHNRMMRGADRPSVVEGEPGVEFLRSSDERFRPVNLFGGPDGAMYVVDMYRGNIQHRAYMTPYLRGQVVSRGLAEPIHLGRIYRVVHRSTAGRGDRLEAKGRDRGGRSEMVLPGELGGWVALLGDADGWWRDTAQRLLVESGRRDLAGAIEEVSRGCGRAEGRVQAIWTLAGLGEVTREGITTWLRDADARVRVAALRQWEARCGENPAESSSLARVCREFFEHGNEEERRMAVMTAGACLAADRFELLRGWMASCDEDALLREAFYSSCGGLEGQLAREYLASGASGPETPARRIFWEGLLGAWIQRARQALSMDGVFEVLDAPLGEYEWRRKSLLGLLLFRAESGLEESISLLREPEVFRRLAGEKNADVSRDLGRLREHVVWPGAKGRVAKGAPSGRVLTENEQERVRAGRMQYLAVCAPCHGVDGQGMMALGPPLAGSEWVLGAPERLIRVLLHGLEGPIRVRGERWESPRILPSMPAMGGALDNAGMAAVLSYIRRDWGNRAEPVSVGRVGQISTLNQGRDAPWTEETLSKLPVDPPMPAAFGKD